MRKTWLDSAIIITTSPAPTKQIKNYVFGRSCDSTMFTQNRKRIVTFSTDNIEEKNTSKQISIQRTDGSYYLFNRHI